MGEADGTDDSVAEGAEDIEGAEEPSTPSMGGLDVGASVGAVVDQGEDPPPPPPRPPPPEPPEPPPVPVEYDIDILIDMDISKYRSNSKKLQNIGGRVSERQMP